MERINSNCKVRRLGTVKSTNKCRNADFRELCPFGKICKFVHHDDKAGALVSLYHKGEVDKIVSDKIKNFSKPSLLPLIDALPSSFDATEMTYLESKVEVKTRIAAIKKGKKYVHYIIAVDASGSMSNTSSTGRSKWDELKIALAGFLDKINADNPEHRVSVIYFSNYSDVAMKYVLPNEASKNLSKIPFIGKSTDFGGPLLDTLSLIQQYPMSSTLIFMSDGIAAYPKSAVERLKRTLTHKIWVYVIGIECSANSALEKIRDEFSGKSHFDVKASHLNEVLGTIIIRTEFKKSVLYAF